MTGRLRQAGFTVIELLVSIAISALLLTGLTQLLNTGISSMEIVRDRTDLARQARFAMSRMVDSVRGSDRLLLPLADNPATPFLENVREQTVPPSPPQSGSILNTAVLAVTLNRTIDLDGDGTFDADNDGDGRFDEDLPADTQNDGKAGLRDFDDDGNGVADFWLSPSGDDDEGNDLSQSEDWINAVDDDGDGSVDEDPGADNNGDGAPGVVGIDDDNDGSIDEGSASDDDEDGQVDEDWYDPVVFYLRDSVLTERRAVPWDESGDSVVTGQDYVEIAVADNVTLLRFERLPVSAGQQQLVDITLTLGDPDGETINLNARVRVGSLR